MGIQGRAKTELAVISLEPLGKGLDACVQIGICRVANILFQSLRIGPGNLSVAGLHGHVNLFGSLSQMPLESLYKVQQVHRIAVTDVVQAALLLADSSFEHADHPLGNVIDVGKVPASCSRC